MSDNYQQQQIWDLEREVRDLKRRVQDAETELAAQSFLLDKQLLEESPVLGSLRDCFPKLSKTPPDLVARHAALVKGTDDYDNATYPYHVGNTVYLFRCFKERNFFTKDKCFVQVYTLTAKKF